MLFTQKFFKIQKMLTYEPLKFLKKKEKKYGSYIGIREFIQQKKNKWLISEN